MKTTLVYVLLIGGFHAPTVIDGFSSKEKCETAYQQFANEDLKLVHGEGWNKIRPPLNIAYHDHICVGVVK